MFKGIVHRHSKAPFYYRFYPNEPLVLLLSAILAGLLMSFLFIAAANSDESFKPLSKAEPVVRMVLQEAVSEPLAGQVAVAGVALDRMKDRRWPDTSKEVVYQAWQFTGMRAKLRDYSPKEIEVARLAVQLAESGTRPCGTVLWYHTTGIDKPWNDSLQVSCLIGNHIFYGDKETRYGATRG
jgi:N-acetylmuramoyl-L-alanine amidase